MAANKFAFRSNCLHGRHRTQCSRRCVTLSSVRSPMCDYRLRDCFAHQLVTERREMKAVILQDERPGFRSQQAGAINEDHLLFFRQVPQGARKRLHFSWCSEKRSQMEIVQPGSRRPRRKLLPSAQASLSADVVALSPSCAWFYSWVCHSWRSPARRYMSARYFVAKSLLNRRDPASICEVQMTMPKTAKPILAAILASLVGGLAYAYPTLQKSDPGQGATTTSQRPPLDVYGENNP